MVKIHDDFSRLKWRLAVVQELQRGNDDLVRSSIIRTANGVNNRLISKPYPLEVNVGMNMSGRSQEVIEDDNDGASNNITTARYRISIVPTSSKIN